MSSLASYDWPVAREVVAQLDRNPYALYAASVAAGSRRSVMGCSRIVLRFFGAPLEPGDFHWHELRQIHTLALRTWLAERYAPNTANQVLSILRGILRQCYELDLMTERDYQRAAKVPRVRGERAQAGREITAGELRALFGACLKDRPSGRRDAALLGVLYGGGLRRAEAAALEVGDFNAAARTLRVLGKRNKERIVYLPSGAVRAVVAWLTERGAHVALESALFVATKCRGLGYQARALSDNSIQALLRRLERRAGVPHFSAHDFRRTCAGDLLDAGADISTVSKQLGHASVTTTQRYDRRGERAKERASELLCVPFDDGSAEEPQLP